MGMFDTLIFRHPFKCCNCQADIVSTQTKRFERALSEFAEGDVLFGTSIITGVIEENLFCDKCNSLDQKVFISIWHSLFTGAFLTCEEAEKRINSIEKTDLIDYIIFQQERYLKAVENHNSFYSLINQYYQYCSNKEDYIKDDFLNFGKDDFLKFVEKSDSDKSILKKILASLKRVSDLPDGSFCL